MAYACPDWDSEHHRAATLTAKSLNNTNEERVMKQNGKSALLMTTAILLTTVPTFAMEAGSLQETWREGIQSGACHGLMTERECAHFQATLAGLPKGHARDRFLADHLALMHERESVCSCSRFQNEVLYPNVHQVARHF